MHSVASRPRARRAKNFVRVARSHRAGCSAACCRSRCSRPSRAPAAPQEQAWRPPPLAARLLPATPSSLNARRGRTQRLRKELLQLAAALSPPPHAAPPRALRSSALRHDGDTRSGGGGKSSNLGTRCRDCGLRQNSAPRGVMPLHGRQHSMTRKPSPADDSKWAEHAWRSCAASPQAREKDGAGASPASVLHKHRSRVAVAGNGQQPTHARASFRCVVEHGVGNRRLAVRRTAQGRLSDELPSASATAQVSTAGPSSWPAPAPRRGCCSASRVGGARSSDGAGQAARTGSSSGLRAVSAATPQGLRDASQQSSLHIG
jgi:hypothetical protein